MADLYLNKDAFATASNDLKNHCEKIRELYGDIEKSFVQLKHDWDSEAGKKFFQRFEDDLLKNLKNYVTVFEYMGQNLTTASNKYDEVFRAADTVADTEY